MATAHDATGFSQFQATVPAWGTSGNGFGQPTVLKFHFDMADIADELGATIDGSSSDYVTFWDIPAYTFIHSLALYVDTAEGATATVAVSDGSNTMIAATTINTAGTFAGTTGSETLGALGGIWYTSTGSILRATFATAADIDLAVFDVYVICTMLNPA